MSGILAISISVPTPGTAANNAVSGYVTGESIALSTSPSGSTYVWQLSLPSGSTIARAGLTASSGATSSFVPDVEGEYLAVCTVDGTTYTIRCSVTTATVATVSGGTRYLPVTDTSVSAPSTGCVLYLSSSTTPNKLSVKFPDNSIQRLTS